MYIKIIKILLSAIAEALSIMLLAWIALIIFSPSTNNETALGLLLLALIAGGLAGGSLYFVRQSQQSKTVEAIKDLTENDITRLATGGELKLAIAAYRKFHGCRKFFPYKLMYICPFQLDIAMYLLVMATQNAFLNQDVIPANAGNAV